MIHSPAARELLSAHGPLGILRGGGFEAADAPNG